MNAAKMRKLQEQKQKELEPLKQVIRNYVGSDYEELLDFVVHFAETRLKSWFKIELEELHNDKRANG